MASPDWITHAYARDKMNADKPFEPARAAYNEALAIFKHDLTKDPDKARLADEFLTTSTLDYVLNEDLKTRSWCKRASRAPRLRECLEAFSRRVLHYGSIMDVLVQHHPEYVSPVWGAMKFIFGAVVEHERTATVTIAALGDISNAIPSVTFHLHSTRRRR